MTIPADVLAALLNDTSVCLFGGILAMSFCNVPRTWRSCLVFWCGMALMLIPQGLVYLQWSAELRRQLCPVTVHLPILVMLYILTRRLLWPVISILSVYLFCQLRRWIALAVVAVLSGDAFLQNIVEIAVTLPLLLFLLHFASPSIQLLSKYPVKNQCQFGVIPALYYGFDYLTRIYTGLLSSGEPAVLEFMPFVCCIAYLIFLLYNSSTEEQRWQTKQVQDSLKLQLDQSVQQISALRESQEMAARHRHDLRHHLQYLSACIQNGEDDRAQNYISDIFQEIEAQKVKNYCENEAVNLILCSFADRAEKQGIGFVVEGTLPSFITVSDSDLCVILSNALENAICACQPFVRAGESCTVSLQLWFNSKTCKSFIQVTNPCKEKVHFQKGLPVSDQPGHGIGTRSICAIVERYGGIYSFTVQEGQFILRLFL